MIKLLGVFAVDCMSTSSIAVRFASAPSVWLALVRLLIATGMLVPLAFTRYRKELASLDRRVFLSYADSGVFHWLKLLCYI